MMNIKSKARVKALGEVFTPPELVNQMFDKLPPDAWLPEKTFLEPACGNGNFVIEVLRRKVSAGATVLQALQTTYAVDIMQDNVEECRQRCRDMFKDKWNDEYEQTVTTNIIVGNTLKMNFDLPWPCDAEASMQNIDNNFSERNEQKKQPKAKRDPTPRVIKPSSFTRVRILEELLTLAEKLSQQVSINEKAAYTALSRSGRNICFSSSPKRDIIAFKLSQEVVAHTMSGSNLQIGTQKDGKHVWPTIKFEREEDLHVNSKRIEALLQML